MRIVVAPDSFKESMTAPEVARAIEKGIRKVNRTCEVVKVPLADGGEGTSDILIDYFKADRFEVKVTGPLGEKVGATYGIIENNVAIIDVASVIGLHLVPKHKRNPLKTTSYGVGELIIDALNRGAKQFIIGLGGSSTNDGGIGMAQALGVSITSATGQDVPFGGEGLAKTESISFKEMDPRLRRCKFTIVSDVTNKLLGESGASYVYGAQKGANNAMIEQLEAGMKHYASILERDVAKDVVHIKAAGAAGGLGAAFYAFLEADLKRGIDYMIELTNLEREIAKADLVFTGEGKIDDQTLHGKVPFGVAQLAQKYNVPVIAIVGSNKVTTDKIYETGIRAIFSIVQQPLALDDALRTGKTLTEKTVENIMRLILFSLTRSD